MCRKNTIKKIIFTDQKNIKLKKMTELKTPLLKHTHSCPDMLYDNNIFKNKPESKSMTDLFDDNCIYKLFF